MEAKFYRKIKKQLSPKNVLDSIRQNKRMSAILIGSFLLLLYILFNSNGIVPRLKLESQKAEMEQKIKNAEAEQQKLKDQSKALDGDKKAVEKVAREKYGMVRKGEKVYKVAPKK